MPRAPDLVTATRSDLSATSLGEAIEEIVNLVPVAAAWIGAAVAE